MIIKLFQKLFFPSYCIFCRDFGDWVCSGCRSEKFEFYQNQYCLICKQISKQGKIHRNCRNMEGNYLDGVLVTVAYNKYAKLLLKQIKYYHYFDMLSIPASMLKKVLIDNIENPDDYLFVPVPLHWYKKNKRGFNQAELLIRKLGFPVGKIVARERNTPSQVKLNRSQRLENLSKAFVVSGEIRGRRIVLVDDVVTTGTTLQECARVLKLNGAECVLALVWASDAFANN